MKFFSRFGELESAYVIKHPKNSKSKGFGYVVTQTLDLAQRLHDKKHIKIGSKTILIRFHIKNFKKQNREKKKSLRKKSV